MESGRDERWQWEQDWVQGKYKQYKEQSITYMAVEDKMKLREKVSQRAKCIVFLLFKGKNQCLVHGGHDGDKDVMEKMIFFPP